MLFCLTAAFAVCRKPGTSKASKQEVPCETAAADSAPSEALLSLDPFTCNEAAQTKASSDSLPLADPQGASQGIGPFTHPQPVALSSVVTDLSSQVQLRAESSNADQLSKSSQPASQDQMSHIYRRVRRQLPPQVADASNLAQALQGEQAHVLRRRSSFIKASRAEHGQALEPVSLHSWKADAVEAFSSALSAPKAKHNLVGRQSSSIRASDNSFVSAGFAETQQGKTLEVPALHSGPFSGDQSPDGLQHSTRINSKRPQVRPIKHARTTPKKVMHEALQQSIAQVIACTQELQEQHKSVQSMQQSLEVATAEMKVVLYAALCASEQHLHN